MFPCAPVLPSLGPFPSVPGLCPLLSVASVCLRCLSLASPTLCHVALLPGFSLSTLPSQHNYLMSVWGRDGTPVSAVHFSHHPPAPASLCLCRPHPQADCTPPVRAGRRPFSFPCFFVPGIETGGFSLERMNASHPWGFETGKGEHDPEAWDTIILSLPCGKSGLLDRGI